MHESCRSFALKAGVFGLLGSVDTRMAINFFN